jgi:hypothetical protein
MRKNDGVNKGSMVGLGMLLATLVGACGGMGVDDPQATEQATQAESEALSDRCLNVSCQTGTVCNPKTGNCEPARGGRCTISGDPPVTTGCAAGQTCLPISCTNSIPPTCFGTCAP